MTVSKTETDIDSLNAEARANFDKLDFKKATEVANKAYKLASKMKYQKGIAEALLTRGRLFWVQQDNLLAREVFIQALKIITAIDDKVMLNNVYSLLGITYGQLFLSEECTNYLTEALEVSMSINNEQLMAEDFANLAIAFSKFENYTLAIDYYNKAMTYAKKLSNEKMQAAILTNLSKLYRTSGDYEKALEHGFEALAICERHNEKRMLITIYHNIGASFTELKRFDEAERYVTLFMTLATEYNIMPQITRAELVNAGLKIYQEKYKEAKEILLRVETIPTFKGDIEAIYLYYDLFLKVYEGIGDYKKAYHKLHELMEFDRKQAEANLKAKLEIQELKLTLKG